MSDRATRIGGLFLLLLVAATGCKDLGFVADMIVPETVPPAHKIKKQRTAILIDDPRHLLVDPSLTGVVAERIAYELARKNALRKDDIIPYRKVRDLEASLGEAYGTTPVDRIGKELGAQQVIHVNIEAVELGTAPGVVQPSAAAAVKVIDAANSKRIFPVDATTRDLEGLAASNRGELVVVEERYILKADMQPGEPGVIMRQLADTLGRRIARLFYRYRTNDRGMDRG
jgi:hypothetical protein